MRISKVPPITLREFERISQIILALITAKNANITKSCTCFNVIGAFLLDKYFKMNANPVFGHAIYSIPNTGLLAYCSTPTATNWHCWVEADGWFFDFSSIVFPEIVDAYGLPACNRLMLQKPLSEISTDLPDLSSPDFSITIERNPEFAKNAAQFIRSPDFAEIADAAYRWFKRPPEPIPTQSVFANGLGKNIQAVIDKRLEGAW